MKYCFYIQSLFKLILFRKSISPFEKVITLYYRYLVNQYSPAIDMNTIIQLL